MEGHGDDWLLKFDHTLNQLPLPDGPERQLSRQVGHLGHCDQSAQQGITVGAESHPQGGAGDVEQLLVFVARCGKFRGCCRSAVSEESGTVPRVPVL